MSELLLDALMQLFALLTDINKERESGRANSFVKDYLERQFDDESTSLYLQMYHDYLQTYHGADFLQHDNVIDANQDSNFKKILEICHKLNAEMDKDLKVLVFIQLLKFLKIEDEITGVENKMIDVLADQMKIDTDDYQNLKTFILKKPEQVIDTSSLLLISGDKADSKKDFKHLFNEKQQILVWVLRIKSTNTFIFKYSGGRNLYLNGIRIYQNKVYVFDSGSVIKTSIMPPVYYGKVYEMFLDRSDAERIIYKAIDVEHKFNSKLIGVQQFSLVGRRGQLIGIVGGSGTGKSTLLNVLNGNLKLSHGSITINGYDLKKDKKQLEGVIGYVPQEDMLIEELTVYENLFYNARLCFSKISHDEIKDLVDKALNDFGLVEAKDLKVGNPINKTLSGGQRKRLNIALELIRQPSIMFLDEPTSGLSSMDSEKVMSLLKRQTLNGRLVIINIHQPSSDIYKLFDKLLIIDKGGRVIHNGNPLDAIVYFKKMAHYVNPEERECYTCGNVKTEQPLRIIEARKVTPEGRLIRERKISPQLWYQYYKENFEDKFKWKKSVNKKEKLPPNLFSIPSRWEQFKIFISRDALAKIKDKQYVIINFLEAPILAVILGFFTKYIANAKMGGAYVFSENVNLPAYLFMSVVVALFIGLNVSAEEIIKDRKLLKRESFLNLSRFSYLSAKIFILFIISTIQTLTFVFIGNSILEIQGLNFSYWLILFSISCFANILGLNVSSGLNSVVSIYISIPLILVPQMLFSGVIVEFDKLHSSISNDEYVPIVGDIMTSRWGFEALAVNEFANNKYQKHFFELEKQLSQCNYYASLLLPELKLRNNEVLFTLNKGDVILAQKHLNILTKEFKNQKDNFNLKLHQLTIDNYSESLHEKINKGLDSLIVLNQNRYIKIGKQKDQTIKKLLNKYGSSEGLLQLKQDNYNDVLASWVLAKKEMKQIIFNGEGYLQKKNPIYKEPDHPWGRAHFYAPYKLFGGIKIPTHIFNVLVVWLMSFILFITLYFNVLRKTIAYFERFKLRRLYRRIQKMST